MHVKVNLRIHATFASVSSEDVCMWYSFDAEAMPVVPGMYIVAGNFEFQMPDMDHVAYYPLTNSLSVALEDMTIYDARLKHYEPEHTMDELVAQYKEAGWAVDIGRGRGADYV